MAPKPPTFGPARRSRVGPLDRAHFGGGPDMAPKPPTFGSAWRSRVGPLDFGGGPDMAPKPPTVRGTPAKPWRPAITRECHEATSGRRSAHGRARSNAAAAWSTVTSARRRPTICRPTGSPAGVNPAGTVTAGWPVKLNG
jgi:hypothetical protein